MQKDRGNRQAPKQSNQPEPGTQAAVKKPYASPVLVEYGTIAKLTQGSKTRSNDFKNTKKLRCL